jgi:hypothetical protein
VFTSSSPFLLFDYLRVPYVTGEPTGSPAAGTLPGSWGRLTASRSGRPALVWPILRAEHEAPRPPPSGGLRRFRLGPAILHARLVPDDVVATALAGSPQAWSRLEDLSDDDGGRLASVWRSTDGDLLLPFDPDEVITTFWSERYVGAGGAGGTRGRLRATAMAGYYALRPLLPRRIQIGLRRGYSRVQARTPFPRWPLEGSLHDVYERLLEWCADLAAEPVPWLAPWPSGRTWARVLTHDVETDEGLRRVPALRSVEERTGNTSSWNLVPGRYHVDDAVVAELQQAGFEVGLHGLYHDGRDLEPGQFEQRLPEIRRYADRWAAVGFRSPATHRSWGTMARLPFEYDSSSPDTDPYEPQPGGCCSLLPFHNGELVELPITMPQDHTLFVILRARDGQLWIEKADRIRERGGMALLITHPDYVDQGPVVPAYEQLLRHVGDDPDVWRALPGEVAAWWRRRAVSTPARDGAVWSVSGPAAGEAEIRWTPPTAAPAAAPVASGPASAGSAGHL